MCAIFPIENELRKNKRNTEKKGEQMVNKGKRKPGKRGMLVIKPEVA